MSITPVETFGSLSSEALGRFVYILGMARGGTTVLRDAIAIHDQILVLPDMTHFMNQVWRYRNKVHQRLLNQIFRLPAFYREEEVIQALDEKRRQNLQRYIDEALSSRDLDRMWSVYPVVYGLDKKNPKDSQAVLCWADKANDFYAVDAVAEHFPKGKFIFVVRDPKGAVSSLAKRAAVKESRSFDAAPDITKIVEACISWRRMTQQMLYFRKKYPQRALMVKFEEFLASPAQSLNEIFRFILEGALEERVLLERLGRLAYGATNVPNEGGTGIKREPMERWRRTLGEEEVKLIEGLAGETAVKAGYPVGGHGSVEAIRTILKAVPGSKRKARNIAKIAYLQAYETLI
jgi:hypothetical protein